jgi:hypothetical protein
VVIYNGGYCPYSESESSPTALYNNKGNFSALSPLDQIAAKALEKCGDLRIVDELEGTSTR